MLRETRRPAVATTLGFIVASMLPATYLAIGYPISGERDLSSIVGSFLVIHFFVSLATLLLGVPAYLALRRLRLIRWWSATFGGALIGAAALQSVVSRGHFEPAMVLRYAMLGAAAGLVFWAIWRSGRPQSSSDANL
jgi:hypothetical protein